MSLSGKLEAEVEVNAPAAKFHEAFCHKPHHLSLISPGKIKSVVQHKGDWGKEGTVVSWNYENASDEVIFFHETTEGVAYSCKEIIESIDHANLPTTFKVIEGEPLKQYKSFKSIVKVCPNPKGQGSLVLWTLEYEKLRANIPAPQVCLDYVVHLSKEVDAHLLHAN